MNAPQPVLEGCWMLAAQDAMLDVAAAMAATEQETYPGSIQSAGEPSGTRDSVDISLY